MKKPHVLNRPMFNTGGTSAYGRGITSNLVSKEQRQRFNNGGRVKYYEDYRGGPVYMGGTDIPQWWDPSWGPVLQTGDQRGRIWDPDANDGKGGYVLAENIYKVRGAELGEEKMDYIPTTLRDIETYPPKLPRPDIRDYESEAYDIPESKRAVRSLLAADKRKITDIEDIDIDYMKAQAGSKREQLERSMGYDIGTPVEGDDFAGTSFNVTATEADRVFGEPRKNLLAKVDTESLEEETYDPGALMPQLSPYLKAKKEVEGAAEIPPPAKEEGIWDYLDKRAAAAEKRGLGTALMGAAGDVLAASQLPKKEAIQKLGEGLKAFPLAATKGLEKVEGLKDIAKIQEHIEGAKTEGKIGVEAKKHEGRMDELAEAYKLSNVSKVKLATLKNKFDKDMKEYDIDSMTPELIYKSFMLKNNYNPKGDEKAFALTMITGEHVLPPPKDDKTRNNYLATPGVIFVDEDRIIYKVSKDGIADPVTEAMLGLELQKKEQE